MIIGLFTHSSNDTEVIEATVKVKIKRIDAVRTAIEIGNGNAVIFCIASAISVRRSVASHRERCFTQPFDSSCYLLSATVILSESSQKFTFWGKI